jgi:hypothetical protein
MKCMGQWIGSYGDISPNSGNASGVYPVAISIETPNFTDLPTEQLFSNRLYTSHSKLMKPTMKYARVKICMAEESISHLGRKMCVGRIM